MTQGDGHCVGGIIGLGHALQAEDPLGHVHDLMLGGISVAHHGLLDLHGLIVVEGVILLAIRQAGVPIYEYKPMQVKQAVVGYGNATKHQVMDMTKRILRLETVPKPDDAADAVAIALCHARSSTSLLGRIQNGG